MFEEDVATACSPQHPLERRDALTQYHSRHEPVPTTNHPLPSPAVLYCPSTKKGKGSPYSATERRVPELIPVLGSQPAADVSHKPDGRLPLLSARPAVTPAILKRAVTNFAV